MAADPEAEQPAHVRGQISKIFAMVTDGLSYLDHAGLNRFLVLMDSATEEDADELDEEQWQALCTRFRVNPMQGFTLAGFRELVLGGSPGWGIETKVIADLHREIAPAEDECARVQYELQNEREATRQAVRAQLDAEQERVRVQYELGLREDRRYLADQLDRAHRHRIARHGDASRPGDSVPVEFERRIRTANERMAMALGQTSRQTYPQAVLPGGYCPCVHTPITTRATLLLQSTAPAIRGLTAVEVQELELQLQRLKHERATEGAGGWGAFDPRQAPTSKSGEGAAAEASEDEEGPTVEEIAVPQCEPKPEPEPEPEPELGVHTPRSLVGALPVEVPPPPPAAAA